MCASKNRLLAWSSLALLALVGAGSASAQFPANFVPEDVVTTGVGGPTDLAFTPDGRMLVTRQTGQMTVYSLTTTPATLLATAITFGSGGAPAICSGFERGLLGVEIDPNFATNNFIYLFYSFNKFNTCPTNAPTNPSNPVNRISRFTLPASNVINPASEVILVDNIRSANGNHNAGDLNFGKDGYLYISTGDGGADYAGNSGSGGANDASRDQFQLIGKILRIGVNADGTTFIPATNPFQGAGTERCNVAGEAAVITNKCRETFAWGLRNPFRFSMDPNDPGTRFFINDVGQNAWEEIDLGQSGVDYGWNCREGNHVNNTGGPCSPTPPGMVNPIFEYQHGVQIPGTTSPTGCNSITGGAFVPNGLWPGYDGTYVVSDYVCGWMFRLSAGAPYTATNYTSSSLGTSSAVSLHFGPRGGGQALYYTTFTGGGAVRRIYYSIAGNNPPNAQAAASPLGGQPTLNVTFDATGSSDPDVGNTLTYFWTFGDGTPETSTTNLTIAHNYTTLGNYTASLRVRDNNFAFSTPVSLVIQVGNDPPVASMSVPAPGQLFSVGENISLTGSATDAQQGGLPNSALSWTVLLHHDLHTHPFLGPTTGNNIPLVGPSPEDLLAATNSYLEVRLTATDAGGLTHTVTRNLNPRTVQLTFLTSPAGRTITVNGTNFTGPSTLTSWVNWGLNVNAPNQAPNWQWVSWSDGGAQAHTITSPLSATSYTATFMATPVELQGFTLE